MNVKNCRVCGRIYNYVTGPNMCNSCREALEEKFHVVKEYIREHNGCGIQQVADECGVQVNQIHQWLREERLELVSSEGGITLQCEQCGAPINTGRFCDKCKNNMKNTFNSAYQTAAAPMEKQVDAKTAARMRFLERQ